MDYKKIYDDLIAYRRANLPSGYTENHHIIMRSLGGSDDNDNLVRLTGREHYIAHLLLARFNRCSQTAMALWMMQMKPCEESNRNFVKNSRMYEWARKEFSKYHSSWMKLTTQGKGNSQYGTRWICNIELKENKKISKDSLIPNNWIDGRNKWKDKRHPTTLKNSFRTKLCKEICITDGSQNRQLHYEDQLPIPIGWRLGQVKNRALVQLGEH